MNMTTKQTYILAGTLLTGLALTAGLLASRDSRHEESNAAAVVASPAKKTDGAATVESVVTTPTAAASAGRRVYMDPATGRPSSGPPPIPPGLARFPEVANALSTSSEGLRELPVPIPGGGVMVDLQGRFRSLVTATVNADGTVGLNCGRGMDGCGEADCSTAGHKSPDGNPADQSDKRNP
ncbi:MAG: hypothetical protein KIS67_01605 [Verrucomicrobiae bacterium]|nr:hypothetical protein [Verrucomicrobiae bacterium]